MEAGQAGQQNNSVEMSTPHVNYKNTLTSAEEHYHETMQDAGEYSFEVCCVGTGIGGGFENTNELHVLKYDEAMASKNAKQWHDVIKEEYK